MSLSFPFPAVWRLWGSPRRPHQVHLPLRAAAPYSHSQGWPAPQDLGSHLHASLPEQPASLCPRLVCGFRNETPWNWPATQGRAHTVPAEEIKGTCIILPYSRKYWRELNLVVGPQIAILNVLADLIWQFSMGSPYVYTCMRVRNFGRI